MMNVYLQLAGTSVGLSALACTLCIALDAVPRSGLLLVFLLMVAIQIVHTRINAQECIKT
ncbi:hypothetical protein GCM10007391_08660 [Alteromonas halophila]|uniref:Uncharacterized protein n=1 Tax=Alteromonas halophila TaxID=516698 RepID=A0A918MVG4_9ALTE|nr:hypothetical protein GCM10007391_08660 [Alteromonas halophila]